MFINVLPVDKFKRQPKLLMSIKDKMKLQLMSIQNKKTVQVRNIYKRWNVVLNYANNSMKSNETVPKGVFGSRRDNQLRS